jgi:cardiolipin synthase
MRSLRINKELMIWVYDEKVARESERLFRDDLRDCRQVTLEEVQAWSRPRRFRNSSARLLSNLL